VCLCVDVSVCVSLFPKQQPTEAKKRQLARKEQTQKKNQSTHRERLLYNWLCYRFRYFRVHAAKRTKKLNSSLTPLILSYIPKTIQSSPSLPLPLRATSLSNAAARPFTRPIPLTPSSSTSARTEPPAAFSDDPPSSPPPSSAAGLVAACAVLAAGAGGEEATLVGKKGKTGALSAGR
jgi:hypothetical protein